MRMGVVVTMQSTCREEVCPALSVTLVMTLNVGSPAKDLGSGRVSVTLPLSSVLPAATVSSSRPGMLSSKAIETFP